MTVLSAAKRTALLEKKELLETQLETAYDSLALALADATKSYKFDSAEALQAATKRDFAEFQKIIDFLEARIDYIDRKLSGGLNFNLNVRRKSRRGGYRRGLGW